MSIRKGTDILAYGKLQVEALQRDMGEIVYSSVPLSNESYHLADGSLLSGSGDYADFVSYMAAKVSTNPECFCSESDWQSTVTLSVTGSCGKYVYDSTNNTLRIPKYNGIQEGTILPATIGDLVEAGLPPLSTGASGAHTHTATTGTESAHTHTRGSMDIKGSFQGGRSNSSVSGAFTKGSGTDTYTTGTANSYTISFQASKNWSGSSSAGTSHTHTATINSAGTHTHVMNWGASLQNTTTVQPECTKVLIYIVVKAIAKSTALTNIDSVTSDLNQKADTDLSNVSLSQSAKHSIGRLFFPSDYYVDITLGSSGDEYTAPADGFFSCGITGTTGSTYMQLASYDGGDHSKPMAFATASYCGGWGAAYVPVKAGDTVVSYYGGTNFTLQMFRFVYAESEE